jgi:hypothetical protein
MAIHVRLCDFLTQHGCLTLCTKVHQSRVVIAHFIVSTSNSNMAAAAILKAVGYFRFCILTLERCHEPSCQILLESEEN